MIIDTINPSFDNSYHGDIHPTLAHHWCVNEEAILIDVRTSAELTWVGGVPYAIHLPLKEWPSMALNAQFETHLKTIINRYQDKKIVFLCRSGVRSIAAAQIATQLNLAKAYNIIEGFEGTPNSSSHRGCLNGWKFYNLPWTQS